MLQLTYSMIDRLQLDSLSILKMQFTTNGFYKTQRMHHLQHFVSTIVLGVICVISILSLRMTTPCYTMPDYGRDLKTIGTKSLRMLSQMMNQRLPTENRTWSILAMMI